MCLLTSESVGASDCTDVHGIHRSVHLVPMVRPYDTGLAGGAIPVGVNDSISECEDD